MDKGMNDICFSGEKLKARRKRYGLTQTQLAEKVGLTQVSICAIENNKKSPSASNAARLCRALECVSVMHVLFDWVE